MATSAYEPLSAMDSSFLVFENSNTHMHVGGPAIFDAGPLRVRGRGIDIDAIRAYIGSRLHHVPRYRQRVVFTPIEHWPVWVDDHHFNLNYHVRHTSLPHPGDERQLKRLCGRIMSQPLDRARPLWEAWIVEGLEGGRFALVCKTHHCMVDGISGVDLLAALLQPSADRVIEEQPPWVARPAPTPLDMLRDSLLRRVGLPRRLMRAARDVLDEPEESGQRLVETLSGMWKTISTGLPPPAETPLNRPIGPHRRLDWLALDLAEVKEVKNHLGGTVNDVVLATVAGAVRRFFQHRGVNPGGLEFRVTVPVSTRRPEDHGGMGNQVSAWLVQLPIDERDARRRFDRVREMTASLKQAKQAQGIAALIQAADWVGTIPLTLGVRLTEWLHPYNLIVSNVPGPQFPLYLLGAEMLAGYPLVPLFSNQTLTVAIFSYVGKLCWGVNADWDLVPDLHDFVKAVSLSFDELRRSVKPRTARRVISSAKRAGRRAAAR